MSFLSSIGSSQRKRGRKTVLCGTGGVGKTTAAAKWPKPVLLATEDGASDLAIPAFFGGRAAKNYEELMGPIMELGNPMAEFDFQTIIIDSADWAEAILQKHVAATKKVESLADLENDFGKSEGKADSLFMTLLASLDHLRETKGMHVVIVCHSGVVTFKDPQGASYDIEGPKLHTTSKGGGAGPALYEWADELFFIKQPVHRIEQNEGFSKKNTRKVAVADGEPMVFTQPQPALRAKCRLPGVPPAFSRDDIVNYVAMISGEKLGNIDGDIVNGSSKGSVA